MSRGGLRQRRRLLVGYHLLDTVVAFASLMVCSVVLYLNPTTPVLKSRSPRTVSMNLRVGHIARVVVYTLSMYIVTHLIVFLYLFPLGILLATLRRMNGPCLKRHVTGLLFAAIAQRPRITGLDNLEPGKHYVVVSNYPGSYAGFALMWLFPDASILVHSFLSRVPIVGFLLRKTGATFVRQRRYGSTKRAIDETIRHLGDRSVVVLPEGKRSPDGQLSVFRRGFVYVLRQTSLDLLPVTLNGFYRLKPARRIYLDPDSDLEVFIHQPVRRSVMNALGDAALVKLTVDTISSRYRP